MTKIVVHYVGNKMYLCLSISRKMYHISILKVYIRMQHKW